MLNNKHSNITLIHFGALALLAFSMPLSNFLMSVSQFIILLNWFFYDNFLHKLKSFFTNKIALAFISIYVLHVAGLIYTYDFNYALNDLRIKLPWLTLPLLLYTGPRITKGQLETILSVFIIGVLTSTIYSTYLFLLTHTTYENIRHISPLISHIRLSLFVLLAIYFLTYFIFTGHWRLAVKLLLGLVALWLILFLFILNSATGISLLIITTFLILIFYSLRQFKQHTTQVIFVLIGIGILIFTGFSYTQRLWERFTQPLPAINNQILYSTVQGNPYTHDPENKQIENGYFIWRNICETEMRTLWNQKSRLNFDGSDLQKHPIRVTLLRYLTSKGLSKDAAGVNALTDQDIENIEDGIPSILFTQNNPVKQQIASTAFAWQLYTYENNPNGSTIFQRIEYWKASWQIIQKHFLFGVGTGDLQQAFNEHYIQTNSSLNKDLRFRSHNQYLAIWIGLGLIGFIVFIGAMLFPVIYSKSYRNTLFVLFFITALLSMLTEDTLETQAGITFFIFFYSLFNFQKLYDANV